MAPSSIATAADYADAMLVARRAKNWIILLLLVMLAIDVALFFMARYDVVSLHPPATASSTVATTQPAGSQAAPPVSKAGMKLQYVVGLIGFLGIVLSIVLTILMLVLLLIMLVGRLIGISHVMTSFIACLILTVLLFPWQAFLNNAGLTAEQADFKIPGILYTHSELVHHAQFSSTPWQAALLGWARFLVFPLLAMGLLIWIHNRSRRGLRLALGEAEPPLPHEPPA